MSQPGRALTWTRRGVEALAVAWVIGLGIVFVLRLTFPLELEWMEGGVLHQALRLQRGEPIYPPPSVEFVPFLYTPLYPAVLAVLGSVLPLDYVLARVVSILSVVAIGAAVWRAVVFEGKPRSHRILAVGLLCAGYVFTFRWLDLARPDALYMASTLWGLVLLRQSRGKVRTVVAAGLLIALGFWTKQTAATFVLASGIGALLVAPRQSWIYAATIAVVAGGGVLVGNAMSDGRLWHYIYELHQAHAFNDERFTKKTWGMFVHAAPFLVVLLVIAVGHFVRALRRSRQAEAPSAPPWRGWTYWGLMAATGLLVSALGYSTQWAEPNAFIPGVVMGAVFLAVALPVGGRLEIAALVLAGGQLLFAALLEPMYQPIQDDGCKAIGKSYAWQNLDRTVPTAKARADAAALRASLEVQRGAVLALSRPWWSVLAGGPGHVGSMGLNDVTPEQRAAMMQALRESVAAGQYDRIWFEGEPPKWLLRSLSGHRVEKRLQGEDRVRPMSGYMSKAGMVTSYRQDQILMVPIGDRPMPASGTIIADFEDGTVQGFEITGNAFGRAPVRGIISRLPPVGPHGGQYLLSSAGRMGRLQGIGTATSPVIELPASGRLEALIGTTGRSKGLSVTVIEEGSGREQAVDIPDTRLTLKPVQWSIPPDWAGKPVRLRLEDQSKKAALFLDDLWVVSE